MGCRLFSRIVGATAVVACAVGCVGYVTGISAEIDGGVEGGDGATGDAGADAASGDAGEPAIDAGQIPFETVLADRLSVSTATVPSGVASGVSNWRIWGRSSLRVAPVFTVPLANCETLVGYTGQDGVARAVRFAADGTPAETHTLAASRELRGLAAEPDGHFAALLWDDGGDRMFVHRFTAAGTPDWTEEIGNDSNVPDDFGIGESRLEYGDGRYGAYYHVHGISGFSAGHEGDTLKWVTIAGVESTGWSWGCSHSMSVLLRYNDQDERFMPACVTDCYPGTSPDDSETPFALTSIGGIYVNQSSKVMDVNAGCNGDVAGELGGAAIAPSGWTMVFNAHQNAATLGQSSYSSATMNQDIGFVTVTSGYGSGDVVWLTSTEDKNEADSTVARWTPGGDSLEQYLVGWMEPGSLPSYKLARVSAAGAILEGPIDVGATASWGRRADPMRRHVDGDVVWAWFGAPGSTTLNLARVDAGQFAGCASF